MPVWIVSTAGVSTSTTIDQPALELAVDDRRPCPSVVVERVTTAAHGSPSSSASAVPVAAWTASLDWTPQKHEVRALRPHDVGERPRDA